MFDLTVYNGHKTIPSLWDEFYKNVNHEQEFLFYYEDHQRKSFTFKELHAKAHCFSAFMLANGLKKGVNALILSKYNPNFIVIDLACQLIGISSLTISPTVSNEQIQECTLKLNPQIIIIEGYDLFLSFSPYFGNNQVLKILLENQLDKIKISGIENVILYETAIELGKVYWRENQEYIYNLKLKVEEKSDLFFIDPSKKISHKEFIANIIKIFKLNSFKLKKADSSKILISLLPSHLLYRYFVYLGLYTHFRIFLNPVEKVNTKYIRKNRIQFWICSGKKFSDFTEIWFQEKLKKWWFKLAIQSNQLKFQLSIQKQNLPFGLKIKLMITSILRKILKMYWGKLENIHILENETSSHEFSLWNSIHIPLVSYQIDKNGSVIKVNLVNLNKYPTLPDLSNSSISLYNENFF